MRDFGNHAGAILRDVELGVTPSMIYASVLSLTDDKHVALRFYRAALHIAAQRMEAQ